jgi:hypothetical protein
MMILWRSSEGRGACVYAVVSMVVEKRTQHQGEYIYLKMAVPGIAF